MPSKSSQLRRSEPALYCIPFQPVWTNTHITSSRKRSPRHSRVGPFKKTLFDILISGNFPYKITELSYVWKKLNILGWNTSIFLCHKCLRMTIIGRPVIHRFCRSTYRHALTWFSQNQMNISALSKLLEILVYFLYGNSDLYIVNDVIASPSKIKVRSHLNLNCRCSLLYMFIWIVDVFCCENL